MYVKYLRGGVIISISVAGDLTFSPYVVIGYCLPPDGRLSLLKLCEPGEYAVVALAVQQIDSNWRVIALHQINQVQHPHKSHL